MYEQHRRAQVGEVRRSKPVGLPGWVQWIREQQQAVDKLRLFGHQHAGLAAAIRNSADKDGTARPLPEREHLFSKSGAIFGRVGRPWRSIGTLLPERQIVADDLDA